MGYRGKARDESDRWCRFWRNELNAVAFVPSRRDQVTETLSRFGRSCNKLSMTGSCGWSLTIRCEKQARASPGGKAARGRCSLTRANLAAGYADCVRLVEWPDKTGWQKLDGSQPGRVQPGLIRQDPGFGQTVVRRATVAALFPWVPESGWPLPLCKQDWLAGWSVKRYGMGSKWRLFGREHATWLVMAQLL